METRGVCKEFIGKGNSNRIVHNDVFLKGFPTNLAVVKVMQLVLLLSEKEVDHDDCPDAVNEGIGTSAKLGEELSNATHKQAAAVLSVAAA